MNVAMSRNNVANDVGRVVLETPVVEMFAEPLPCAFKRCISGFYAQSNGLVVEYYISEHLRCRCRRNVSTLKNNVGIDARPG